MGTYIKFDALESNVNASFEGSDCVFWLFDGLEAATVSTYHNTVMVNGFPSVLKNILKTVNHLIGFMLLDDVVVIILRHRIGQTV